MWLRRSPSRRSGPGRAPSTLQIDRFSWPGYAPESALCRTNRTFRTRPRRRRPSVVDVRLIENGMQVEVVAQPSTASLSSTPSLPWRFLGGIGGHGRSTRRPSATTSLRASSRGWTPRSRAGTGATIEFYLDTKGAPLLRPRDSPRDRRRQSGFPQAGLALALKRCRMTRCFAGRPALSTGHAPFRPRTSPAATTALLARSA
jgi:hypothetical protein